MLHAVEGAKRVVLAQEPPFHIGPLLIEPAFRQVSCGDRRVTVEPRVMQVLVVLGNASDRIVSRDELILRCWDGVAVGDNAINRTISRLRQLAAEFAGSFGIETIAKVGYRLEIAGSPPRSVAEQAEKRPAFRLTRRTAITAAASAGMALTGGGYWLWQERGAARREEAERHMRAGLSSERMGEAGWSQATLHYTAATEADPSFAAAWGGLARLLAWRATRESEIEGGRFRNRAQEAAARALELDAANADAMLAQVLARPMFRNWTEVERDARAVLRRYPDLNLARRTLALFLSHVGRNRAALEVMRDFLKREPMVPGLRARIGWLLWQTGDPQAARPLLDQAARFWPNSMWAWYFRFTFLCETDPAAALAMVDRDGAVIPAALPLPLPIAVLCARASASAASTADRKRAVEAIGPNREKNGVGSFVSIPFLSALGEQELAFTQCYDYYFGQRDAVTGERAPLPRSVERFTDFLFTTATAEMRADPRFPRLTAAIGLDAYW